MQDKLFKKRKLQTSLLFFIIVLATYFSSMITQFNLIHGFATIPKAIHWMLSNLVIKEETIGNLPGILEKLVETIFMSIAATTIAAVISFLLGCVGSKTTAFNSFASVFARFIASISRNVPVVAWALILLLSFGQNSMTGFLALFVGTVGFLTRAFIETIDEADQRACEALKAAGATYFHIMFKAVIPQTLPQMISWVLFMIETNIRSATLVGILTGTGIGYAFDLYYKMLDYGTVSMITLVIVLSVILIELISTHIRKVIL